MRTESTSVKIPVNSKFKSYFSALYRDVKRDKALYALLILPVLYFALFHYKPMYGLQMAFQDYSLYKGIDGSKWVGFENFRMFFESPYFLRTLKNTVLISLYQLVFAFPAPIILAVLFNEVIGKRLKKAFQTACYIPHFVSAVIVTGLVTRFCATNGIVNVIASLFGAEKQNYLTMPEYFRGIYTFMTVWQNTGFDSIIYSAALMSVDTSLYEAASIDGANKWKRMIHVTFPSILPTIVTMFIIKLGNFLNVGADNIILLYQPVTYETADTISTYVYRVGLENSQYSLAAAVGLVNGIVGLILVYVSNYVSRRVTESSLW